MSIRDKLTGKTTKLAEERPRTEDHPAKLHNYKDGDFFSVEVSQIVPNPDQPRKYFDEQALEELTHSIKQNGVLQPVIIRFGQDGKIYLVAGERRYRAAKMAGLEKIPAVFTTGNSAEIALIENLQREDLTPVEESEALARMIEEYNYTQEKLALVVGKARTTITEALSLNKLPDQIKNECRRADNYPRRLLVEVAKQKTLEDMFSLFNQIKNNELKSAQVREITRKRADKPQRTPAAIVLEKTMSLNNNLSKLDVSTIEEQEKTQLLSELHSLKKVIEKILS